MSKDKFKELGARGGGLFNDRIDEFQGNESSSSKDEPKVHTIRIRPSLIEKTKDYVHLEKFNGNPYITQGDVISTALEEFFERAGKIPERPDELKKMERRYTGRKKKKGNDFEL